MIQADNFFFFNVFVYFWQREREHEWGRGRERMRHRIRSRLQALSCQHRARWGAQTHKPWDHDLSRGWMLNQLSHPGALHFEFIFVYGVRKWSSLALLHVAVQFSQCHLFKRLSFFHWIFFPASSKISWPYSCGSISGFSILFHWSMCLLLCQ